VFWKLLDYFRNISKIFGQFKEQIEDSGLLLNYSRSIRKLLDCFEIF